MQPEEVVIADLIRERDEARDQVRSLTEQLAERERMVTRLLAGCAEGREKVRLLTVERDAERERGDRHNVTIGRVGADLAVVLGRLSRAREALKPVREAFEALCNADVFPTDGGPESQTADQLGAGLAALRAALAEPLGGP